MSKWFQSVWQKRWIKWPVLFVLVLLICVNAFLKILGWGMWPWQLESLHVAEHPKFVTHNYIDLSRIEAVSKFRSGAGHDHSDSFESCRSMKHYFAYSQDDPDPSTIEIYGPV